MTAGDELFVTIGGRDVGLQAVLQRVDAEMNKSAQSAVRLGQQYARLAQAQGQPALASQVLAGTMQRAGSATEQALIGIQTQASRLSSGTSFISEFGNAAKSSLLGIIGPAALATSAISGLIAIGKSFSDAFEFKAQLDATTASIKNQLVGFRDAGRTYQEASAFGRQYSITQQETNSILSSSTDILRTSTASVAQLEEALIRLQSRDVSKPISEASRALRELASGDVTSIKELFNIPAKDALKMRDEIVAGGDAVVVLTKYLNDAQIGMSALEQRTQGAVGRMNELKVAQEGAALAQAKWAEGPGMNILIAKTTGLLSITGQLEGKFGDVDAANDVFLSTLFKTGSITEALTARNAALSNSLSEVATTTFRAADADDRVTSSSQQVTSATERQAAAMQEAAAKSVADTAAKQAQAATTALLEGQTKAAADAFLALNPNISGSGVASAVAAGQISAAVAQYINMTIAAQNARNQLAQLQAQAGISPAIKAAAVSAGGGDVGRYITTPVDPKAKAEGAAAVARLKELNAQEKALADAKRDAIITNGTAAQKQALLNKEYQDASRIYGENSEKTIRAKTALDQLTASQAKAHSGGAGGVKLSDQQKLNNALLSDQEKYEQKYDDLDAQHEQRRLDIMLDFQEKMLSAQRDFAQERLDSSASFYDQMGSIEGKSAGKIQKAASEAYEAASLEAGKIAQEKGADVADKYMDAQEQVISARAKRAADIEKAIENKDKGRAEYLKGVDAKYRAAEDAKLARIKEGEGSLASERDKRLQEENRNYEEQSGKLADHAEASADRRILAAERAGKAIDAEAAKAAGLASTYDRIAPAAPTGAATPIATATPAAAAPAGADPITAAVSDAKSAIVDALAAVERAARDTGNAVRGLNGKFAA